MERELYNQLEKPNVIYKDVLGRPYSRGEYSGDYYSVLPEVITYGDNSALIGRMIAERFNNQVLPLSPASGNDYKLNVMFSGKPEAQYRDSVAKIRQSAILDSLVSRRNRGDDLATKWTLEELSGDASKNIGTVGCITSVTTPYVNMFGSNYKYTSNRLLYLDTKSGKSPYKFVIEDLPWNKAKSMLDPDRPGYKMIDRINPGDILSSLYYEHGHALMVTNVKRDSDGHLIGITLRLDRGGLEKPSDLVDTYYDLRKDDPFNIFGKYYVYRINNSEDVNKYLREHPEEIKRINGKKSDTKPKLIPRAKR